MYTYIYHHPLPLHRSVDHSCLVYACDASCACPLNGHLFLDHFHCHSGRDCVLHDGIDECAHHWQTSMNVRMYIYIYIYVYLYIYKMQMHAACVRLCVYMLTRCIGGLRPMGAPPAASGDAFQWRMKRRSEKDWELTVFIILPILVIVSVVLLILRLFDWCLIYVWFTSFKRNPGDSGFFAWAGAIAKFLSAGPHSRHIFCRLWATSTCVSIGPDLHLPWINNVAFQVGL